jgi:hypothetical protein
MQLAVDTVPEAFGVAACGFNFGLGVSARCRGSARGGLPSVLGVLGVPCGGHSRIFSARRAWRWGVSGVLGVVTRGYFHIFFMLGEFGQRIQPPAHHTLSNLGFQSYPTVGRPPLTDDGITASRQQEAATSASIADATAS